ncbi:molybdopterin-dependent oxidoreductase [Algihabitans albus]|uniref:molybdopterin-dependent oxidoreductase n=1 Tax=Algihabitans albus TaxID=2164067 RepID=UPI000E5CEFC0|nr:molybdopterin-dependent oxidoreductase [Algihabitans albus]
MALLICLTLGRPGVASDLPAPEGRVLLEVAGAITQTNAQDDEGQPLAVLDLALLERFGGVRLETETPWTDDLAVFEGIAGQQLIELLGIRGDTAVALAVALNDYQVEIPISDFREAGLLIAYKRNGSPMRVRDNGPLWIVFPYSQIEETDNRAYLARSIWQLRRLEFR